MVATACSVRAYLELNPGREALVLGHGRHLDVREEVIALEHPSLLDGLGVAPDHPVNHEIVLALQVLGELSQPPCHLLRCPVEFPRGLVLPGRRLSG